jgi:DNA-binding response OmpR family regulator
MGEVPSKLVLVVDDDSAVRRLIATALKAKGYDVEQASDGLAASRLLGLMPRLPDLLICDIMMPTIDGFSLARLIKGRPELKALPIIFLTARTEVTDVVNGINLGARHYVQKPFSIKELIDKVESTVK